MAKHTFAMALVVCATSWGLATDAAPTQTRSAADQIMLPTTYGPDLYKSFCGACHGADARGGGPVSRELKTPPPDLTLLARRHDGVFPASYVHDVIAGKVDPAIPAHGTREMPVWGFAFQAADAHGHPMDLSIDNLVQYLASIQTKGCACARPFPMRSR